jgi:hypothetical protein
MISSRIGNLFPWRQNGGGIFGIWLLLYFLGVCGVFLRVLFDIQYVTQNNHILNLPTIV